MHNDICIISYYFQIVYWIKLQNSTNQLKHEMGLVLFLAPYLYSYLLGMLVVPSLFYAFNVNLRRFVVKEIKDALGLDQNIVQLQNSSIWSTNVQIET